MIRPSDDKNAIKRILASDPYISRAGFTEENIKTTKYGTDTLNSSNPDFQIFIYLGTPENPSNSIQKGVVFNVSVTGKRDNASRVDSVMAQAIGLLNEANLGHSNIIYLLDPPMELESDPAIYMTECSFIAYETIFNKIQK